MIRPLAALTRQVQEFFHAHLVGLYGWEDVEFSPREKNMVPAPDTWERNKRGRRIRPERPEGKYHAALRLRFGVWDLEVDGPNERPPLGWLKLSGHNTMEGPLDPSTWNKFAEHIKENHEEREHGRAVSWS